MRRTKLWLVPFLSCFAFGSVLADQVVHFRNGTTMAIQSHEVVGDTIHVSLGGGSAMAFPLTQVERIEEAGRDILDLDGAPANRQVELRKVTGFIPSARKRGTAVDRLLDRTDNSFFETDPTTGLRVHRPYANDPVEARRQVTVTGRRRQLSAATGGGGKGSTYEQGSKVRVVRDSISKKATLTSPMFQPAPPKKKTVPTQENPQ